MSAHPRPEIESDKIGEGWIRGEIVHPIDVSNEDGHHRRDPLGGDQLVENQPRRDDARRGFGVEGDEQRIGRAFCRISGRRVKSG